jgi:hypothetical protein
MSFVLTFIISLWELCLSVALFPLVALPHPQLDLVMLRLNIKKATVIAGVGMVAPFLAFLPVGYLMYTHFVHLSDHGLKYATSICCCELLFFFHAFCLICRHYDNVPKNESLLHHETGQVHLFPFLLFCGIAACLTVRNGFGACLLVGFFLSFLSAPFLASVGISHISHAPGVPRASAHPGGAQAPEHQSRDHSHLRGCCERYAGVGFACLSDCSGQSVAFRKYRLCDDCAHSLLLFHVLCNQAGALLLMRSSYSSSSFSSSSLLLPFSLSGP